MRGTPYDPQDDLSGKRAQGAAPSLKVIIQTCGSFAIDRKQKASLAMPPKKVLRVCEPSGDNVRWVDGWPYRVYADGYVLIGTGAKGSMFPRFSVRLTSYVDADYNNLTWRDSVVQEVIIRGNKGRGPGAHWRFDFALHLPYSLHLAGCISDVSSASCAQVQL